MSFWTEKWAYEQQTVSSGAKFVLVCLAHHADEDGYCYPSQKRLAAMTGLTDRAVRGHLAALEEAELIAREQRRGRDGRRSSDGIWLLIPEDELRLPAEVSGRKTQPEENDTPTGRKQPSNRKKTTASPEISSGPILNESPENHHELPVVGATPTGEPPLPDDETARSLLLLKRVSGFPRNQGENALYLAELREEFPDVDAVEVCRQYEVWHRDNQNKTKNHRGRLRNFFSKANGDISSGRKPPSRASPISPKNDAANDKWKPEMLSDDELRKRGIVNW